MLRDTPSDPSAVRFTSWTWFGSVRWVMSAVRSNANRGLTTLAIRWPQAICCVVIINNFLQIPTHWQTSIKIYPTTCSVRSLYFRFRRTGFG